MSNMKLTAAPASEGSSFFANLRHKMPKDTGIFVVMLVIALTFEIAGWYVRDQSFLLNTNRLVLIVLQVAIIGIIAVGAVHGYFFRRVRRRKVNAYDEAFSGAFACHGRGEQEKRARSAYDAHGGAF